MYTSHRFSGIHESWFPSIHCETFYGTDTVDAPSTVLRNARPRTEYSSARYQSFLVSSPL